MTAPGWEVERDPESSGDEYGGHVGEMTLTDGSGRFISLHWYPAAQYDNYVDDRQNGVESSSHTTVDGRDALLFDEGTAFSTWWLEADNTFGLRGDNFATVDDYLAIAATIRAVDQATWRAALPADTVKPDDRATAVETMLAGLPVPDGLDVDALVATGTANGTQAVEHESSTR